MLCFVFFVGLMSTATAQYKLVKANVAGVAVRSFGLAFEKVRDRQYSWQISASYVLPSEAQNPFLKPVLEHRQFDSGNISGYSGTIEYRFYTYRAKSEATKPYIAFFGRYYAIDGKLNFSDEESDYAMKGNMTTMTLGLQFGAQWVFKNKWIVDATIVGIGYSRSQLRGTLTTSNEDPNIGLLEDDFSAIPVLGSRFRFSGLDGDYSFDRDFGTMGIRMAIYVGMLL